MTGAPVTLVEILDASPDYVMHVDRTGAFRYLNRAFSGVAAGELIGTSLFDRIPVDQLDHARGAFESVIATGEPEELELHVIDGGDGGAAKFFQLRLAAVRRDSEIAGCVIAGRDVTGGKRADLQIVFADRMASVSTLAAGLAHEINNPLAAVIANLDMAEQDVTALARTAALPPDLADEIHDARRGAERVREIVRDLTVFSRAREDRRGAVDIEKVLESALHMAWTEIRPRAKVVRAYDKVPRVDANEGRLGQVFFNLIVNAAQAIPEGNSAANEIRIATSARDGRVVIAITDTGTGIAPDVKRRLFQPFVTTKTGAGSGLGLAISHRIVTALGGTIAAGPAPGPRTGTGTGTGTTFEVTLPAAPAELAPITEEVALRRPAVRRGRVLIVDDEHSLVQVVKRYLARDHDVYGVTSGKAAIEKLEAGERFDAIVCDLMMPDVTGVDVHAAASRIDPDIARRMIFVTGGAFTATAGSFLHATQNPHMDKPFDLALLKALVNDLVK